jgi:glutathione synthase/RimK-type ligase-like ATP-grasp enzyme
MKKQIVLITGNKNFFGQTRKPWTSIDTAKMIGSLNDSGYKVDVYEYSDLVNKGQAITNSIIFYSFSQKDNVRFYMNDLIHFLDNGSNWIIPSYQLLKCHENKGYQELYKKELGIDSLQCQYYSSSSELQIEKISFPVVLKTVDGSNGKGVFLIQSVAQLNKVLNKINPQSFFTKLDLIRRKYFRRKKSYKEYPNYSNKTDYFEYKNYIKQESPFILQQFIPNLTFDFRILIMYDKFFVTKRHSKKNDFRASGAKNFDFNFEFDFGLLTYAQKIYKKFDTLFLSIDIAYDDKTYYLLEYQALHFGINVFVKNNGYYLFNNNKFEFKLNQLDFETTLAQSLIKYIHNNPKR